MKKYKVRSGQNIFDVAITLHGSVEGVFDLLASNPWLTMETVLEYGMELDYHDELVVNSNIVSWIKSNGIIVKNGEHICRNKDLEEHVKKFFNENHPGFEDYMASMSADEQNMFWETQYTPKMIIRQAGDYTVIRFELKDGKHMFIDWGDIDELQSYSCMQSGILHEVEHCYKGDGPHTITIYGDCEFFILDFTELNGIYFPLESIYADSFLTNIKTENQNKLIITL